MAASLVKRTVLNRRLSLDLNLTYQRLLGCRKVFYTSDGEPNRNTLSHGEQAISKFGRIVEKVQGNRDDPSSKSDTDNQIETITKDESFATMFRHSKLVSLGEYKNRLVKGKIIEVMGDDLYIDFGAKFHCVCPRPRTDPGKYKRGTEVLLMLQDVEMSSAFLGSDIHVTLLEADAILMATIKEKQNNELLKSTLPSSKIWTSAPQPS